MDAAHIDAFRDRFDLVARERLSADDLVPEVRVDLAVPMADIGEDLERLLRHFEPFGIGNPAPVLRTEGVRLAAPPRRVGTDGLKLQIETEQGTLDGIGWGMAGRMAELDVSRPLDLVFRLDRDEYRGVSRLQLKLADLRTGN